MTDTSKAAHLPDATRADSDPPPTRPVPANAKHPDASGTVSTEQQVSDTGAVLGKPDEEYGAYGMVKGDSIDRTPSRSERKIRGVR